MSKEIRILIVDDHMVVRKGLKHVIQSFEGITVVAEAENGEEALFLCKQFQPDVVLMDVKMEGMGGIAVTKVIRQFYPQTRVLALSTFRDKEIVLKMLESQANGYLLKSISSKELEQAICAVYAGETVFSPEISQLLERDSSTSPSEIKLSKQQKKVLTLLSRGLSNVEIAEKLNISQSTARYHVSAILVKLGVNNRVEAATFALKQGLLEK